jgi:hypothetical protein
MIFVIHNRRSSSLRYKEASSAREIEADGGFNDEPRSKRAGARIVGE